MHQKDDLKMRVHSYIAEVARVENMMALKVSTKGGIVIPP